MSAEQVRKRSNKLSVAGGTEAVAESAKRQLGAASSVAIDAAQSGSWRYPIQGVFYLLSHPSLLQPILPVIFKGVIASAAILAGLFTFTYLPQVAVLAFVSGPLAFVAAIPLVLGEGYILVNWVLRSFFFGQLSVDLFDAVLLQKGHKSLVEKGRKITVGKGKVQLLGKALGRPLSGLSIDSAVRYVLTLPLNFIPVVGTAFFLGLNGYKGGPSHHARYFELKGYSKQKRDEVVSASRGSYTAFGVIALVLNLIPVASIFFTFTTSIGAALWAADIEAKSGSPAVDANEEVSLGPH